MARTGTVNPLAGGFYTVSEAVRLVQGARSNRIYGWLRGYPNRDIGPLLTRDYSPINDNQELSFYDLIEVRFVEHFRDHEVKLRTLRLAGAELRKLFNVSHPFATDRVHLLADKADVFLEVMHKNAKRENDRALLSLTTKNYVMEEIIRRDLVPGIRFDKRTHLPEQWKPRPEQYPNIIVDPRIAYGQPVGPSRIPTATLYETWIAENQNVDEVAFWHNINASEVTEAVGFEELLDRKEAMAA